MQTRTQLQTIFEYLQNHVATASMVAEATGVPQKNLCRYKRDLERLGQLAEVRKGVCQLRLQGVVHHDRPRPISQAFTTQSF